MNVDNKFQIGDKVFLRHSAKQRQFTILSVEARWILKNKPPLISYHLKEGGIFAEHDLIAATDDVRKQYLKDEISKLTGQLETAKKQLEKLK